MGTRICVKGLPRHADEATLRTHFANIGSSNGAGGGGGGRAGSTSSSKVIITDAKVVRTPDGRSRQFGFVGFRSHEDALRALEYFDRSFMGAAKLSVEWASGVGGGAGGGGGGGGERDGEEAAAAAPLSRPWSKYTKAKLAADAAQMRTNEQQQQQQELPPPPPLAGGGKGAGAKGGAAAPAASKSSKAEDDPRFAEFLSLMAPRSAVPLWANDDGTAAAAVGAKQPSTPAPKKDGKKVGGGGESGDDDDDELYEELPASKEAREDESDGEDKPVPPLSDPAVADAAVSDFDYLKRRVVSEISSDEEEDEEDDEKEDGRSSEDDGGNGDGGALPPPPPLHDGQGDGASAAAAAVAAAAAGQEGRHSNGGSGLDLEAELQACRGRLFLRNLPFTATEDDVRALFEEHRDSRELWELRSVHVVLDRVSRQSRGIALVQLSAPAGGGAATPAEGSKAAADALGAAASAALRALDGSIFQGRLLHVMPARPAPEHEREGGGEEGAGGEDGARGNGGDTSFKAAREASRRAAAGGAGDSKAWNSLFMRQDTVAAAVAAHFGVSKSDLLSRDAGDSPAVRLALGEAHVIAATKAALAAAGVDVARLEASAAAAGSGGRGKDGAPAPSIKRSSTALLIKNLPFATTERELRSLLAPFGPLKRLVLPATKAVALCEFGAPPDARSALRGLAYRRLHHVPLYLEWAPFGVFAEGAPTLMEQPQQGEKEKGEGQEEGETVAAEAAAAAAAAAPEEAATTKKQRKAEAVAAAAAAAAETTSGLASPGAAGAEAPASDAAASTRTLFVKNLAWATDDEHLRGHFETLLRSVKLPATALRSARVARKKGPPGSKESLLSAGFGFVELESEGAAAAVLRACQRGSRGGAPPLPRLDGHALVVEPASAAAPAAGSAAPKTKKDDVRTKLAVLNVAFQATRNDLVSLFSPFGAVKSCRIPKKAAALDGSHRGYAFVDFASHGEARAALAGLSGTHLYGRRLALQWAEEDAPDAASPGGIDALTERSARRSRAAGEDGGGRSAKRLRGNEFQV